MSHNRKTIDPKAIETKREQIRIALQQKQDSLSNAQRIIERLLDDPITDDFLKDCARFLEPRHYDDVVDERMVAKQCGYPLCCDKLRDIPKQRYHISATLNRVYDLTERRKFCSNACYKASMFYRKQLPTTPVWVRGKEPVDVPIELLPITKKAKDVVIKGEDVIWNNTSDETKPLTIPNLSEEFKQTSISGEMKHIPSKPIANEQNKSPRHELSTKTPVSETSYRQQSNKQLQFGANVGKTDDNNLSVGEILTVDIMPSMEVVPKNCLGQSHGDTTTVDNATAMLNEVSNVIRLQPDNIDGAAGGDKRQSTEDGRLKAPSLSCGEAAAGDSPQTDIDIVKSAAGMKNQDLKAQTVQQSHQKTAQQRKVKMIDAPMLQPKGATKHVIKPKADNLSAVVKRNVQEWWTESSHQFVVKSDQSIPLQIEIPPIENETAVAGHPKILEQSPKEAVQLKAPSHSEKEEFSKAPLTSIKIQPDVASVKAADFPSERCTMPTCLPHHDAGEFSVLPPVDSHSHMALRRKIVFEKLSGCIKECLPVGITIYSVMGDLKCLVATFNLTSHNVMLHPRQCMITSVAILKILASRRTDIAKALDSLAARHYVEMLLEQEGTTVEAVEAIVASVLPPKTTPDSSAEYVGETRLHDATLYLTGDDGEEDECLVDIDQYESELD